MQAIQALGAAMPCRLRKLHTALDASALPALDAITTLQHLESCAMALPKERQWQPLLPQLTALICQGNKFKLSLDGVAALREVQLSIVDRGAATVSARAPLGSLTALRFQGNKLSFPWQQARGLQQLYLASSAFEPGPLRVRGVSQLTALTRLHSLALELPLNGLPSSTAWLGGVTALKTDVTGQAQQSINQVGGLQKLLLPASVHGVRCCTFRPACCRVGPPLLCDAHAPLHRLQALHLIASTPNLAKLKIFNELASGAHVICKWAWTLVGKVPDSLQSVRVHAFIDEARGFEQCVEREAGEATEAMLCRLASQVNPQLEW